MDKIIKLETHQEAQALFGLNDENARIIEKELKVKLTLRGEHLKISGTVPNIKKASELIGYILQALRSHTSELGKQDLTCLIANFKKPAKTASFDNSNLSASRLSGTKLIGPKT
ncbi:MAG: hypothetical protein NT066_05820, partial [Candidatus Omnitrophica bacterium]|nr:hypothetical protein [Candidatus Omnitrophota bacterium]